jgi:prepilin-type N-terminal cleavage/methylation domain-containing protein
MRRGFTLIELMIALALAGLVVGGALQLHIAFNRQAQRQQAIAEIQQTLRVSMQLLERAIRSAGQGLPSTHQLPALAGSGCAATSYYGFSFSNSNVYTDPKTTYYTNGNNADSDPDWFRVVSSDTIGDSGATLNSHNAVFTDFYGVGQQNWNVGDLFMVLDSCAGCVGQVRQVMTGFNGTTPPGSPGQVKHQKGGSCYNLAPGNCPACDKCLGNFGCASPGAPIRHFGGTSTVYRILDGNDADFPQPTPRLAMATPAFGTASNQVQWTVLADNVEDMQLAIILSDGTVCTYDDSPLAGHCPFDKAVAIRVTLVGRSTVPIPGVTPSPQGGYEDYPTQALPANPDGYIRRALTTTVILRNYL